MKRELIALVLLPLVVAIIVWAPAWTFLIVLGLIVTGAAEEFTRMAKGSSIACGRWLPPLSAAGLMIAGWFWGMSGLCIVVVAVIILHSTAQLIQPESPTGSLAGAAVGSFAALYLGLTGACLGWLRLWPDDALAVPLVLLFLGTIWIGDSGAYYVGTRLGRHRMSPKISPNKTWEGLAGGVAATFIAAPVLKLVLAVPLAWIHVIAVAAILAVAGPVGDLVESQFKRDTDVKDSSSLLPGHGGLFDRTDSLLFAAPPVLGYLALVGALR
jgi:phosphatidate cytidylyltransferase